MGILTEVLAIKDREDATKTALANLPQTLIQGYMQGLAIKEKQAEIVNLQSQAQARQGQANLYTLMKASSLKKNAYDMKDQQMLDLANAMQGSVLGTTTDYRQALDPEVAKAMPPYVGPAAVTTPSSPVNDITNESKQNITDVSQIVPEGIIKSAGELDKWGQPTQKALMSKKMADTLISNSAEKVKPPTDAERTANIFATRAVESNKIFDQLDSYIGDQGIDKWWQSVAPNFLKGANQQKYEQAQRDFVNAALREESGAVISPEEFDNARKQYFPQPGDTKEVIAQKAKNRITEIEGLKGTAGKAYNQQTTQESAKTSNSKSFVEGGIYNSNGVRRMYKAGKWVPVQ